MLLPEFNNLLGLLNPRESFVRMQCRAHMQLAFGKNFWSAGW